VNRKQVTYVLAAVAVIAVGVIIYLGSQGGTGEIAALGGGAYTIDIKPDDHIHGSPDAPVTMVEYASATCTHCAAFQKEVVPQLAHDYLDTGKVKLIYREFPLNGADRIAFAVARCLQGDAYFTFIDQLYQNQQAWIQDFDHNNQITAEDVQEGMVQMGRIAGMGRDKVLMCASDMELLGQVDANWQEAQTRYHVDSTPTIVIGGEVHKGEITYDDLKKILDPLVAKN
jgi:protein-disulfide isomerase